MLRHLSEKVDDNLAAADGCIDLLRCCASMQNKAQTDMAKVLPLYEDLTSLAARTDVGERRLSPRSNPRPSCNESSRGARNIKIQQQGLHLEDSSHDSSDIYRDLVQRSYALCTT